MNQIGMGSWCPDRNRDLVLETYVSMVEGKI